VTVLYVLIPLALLTGAAAVAAFLWATGNGQLDDLDTPALRILNDEEGEGSGASASPRSIAAANDSSGPAS